MIPLKDMFAGFCCTNEEWNYLAVGAALGSSITSLLALGMVLVL